MIDPDIKNETGGKADSDESALRTTFFTRLETLLDVRGYPRECDVRIKQLAVELGLSAMHIRKVFQTQIASPLLLSRLATALNTSVDYFLGRTEIFDSAVVPAHDASLVAWLWRPVSAMMDIPVPPTCTAAGPLKGMWAMKQTTALGRRYEFVIYDSADINLVNGQAFLMELDGILQIRSLEMLKKRFARFWFHEAGLETVIHLDRLKPNAAAPRGKVIGKIISRMELMNDKFVPGSAQE